MALSQFINNDLDVIPAKRLVYLQGHWPWGQPLHDRTTVDTQCTPTAINKHTRNRNLEISTDCGNQLIHGRLYKTKLIGRGSDSESQAGRQSDGYGGWCLELRRGGR